MTNLRIVLFCDSCITVNYICIRSGHGLHDGIRIVPFRYTCSKCSSEPLSTSDLILNQLTTSERELYPFTLTHKSAVSSDLRDLFVTVMMTTDKQSSGVLNAMKYLRTSRYIQKRLCYLEACDKYGMVSIDWDV